MNYIIKFFILHLMFNGRTNCSTFAKCMQPNKCECLEGYGKDELGVCQPLCSEGCKNGLCFEPEVCLCNPGYIMGPQEQCEPACLLRCQNGSCVEPEICQCHEGYKFRNNSINICEPENETSTMAGAHVTDNQSESTRNLLTTLMALDQTKSLQPDQLRQTSASTLVSADTCNDRCHCWQEFDEYGPLVSKQCVHLCADASDKPCLDLNRCQCDVAKNHLICHASDDSMEQDDDPLFYMCNVERFKATIIKPLNDAVSSDMKSAKPEKGTSFSWLWAATAGIIIILSVIGGLLYLRFKKFEEPVVDYEVCLNDL